MNSDILLQEIIELLPEFKGREQELKDIIDKLIQSQPDAKMDESFKEELRRKVLEEAEKKKKKVIPFRHKLAFLIPSVAAACLAVYLTLGISFQKGSQTPLEGIGEPESLSLAIDGSSENRTSEESILPTEQKDMAPEPVDPLKSNKDSTTTAPQVLEEKNAPVQPTEVSPETYADQPVEAERSEGLLSRMFSKESAAPASEIMTMDEARGYGGEERDFLMEEPLVAQADQQMNTAQEAIVSPQDTMSRQDQEFNTEEFDRIYENDFLTALNDPVSTFSIDVDTASYSNTRRYLMNGSLPPADAVRIEELINYFDYDYPDVTGEHPFEFHTALSNAPWNEEHQLLYVGIQGERKNYVDLPPNNLIFLLDVSGSMSDANKLPLLKQSLELLTKQLRPQDSVAIVVYAGAAGVVLKPTQGNRTQKIIGAFDRLEAGGSTAGGEGIELAYRLAEEHFMEQGNNRIIIATDGDFNVGPSSTSATTRLIEEKRDKGIFLTVLGFGMGNYKDSRMEQMADKGNGNYAYIDNLLEAKKVLVNEISSTLFTIASDVKIQIEFNPHLVDQYRLIGYENRVMANQDFDDDTKDAGELGAGHSVTAIYEIIPKEEGAQDSDSLKYQDQQLNQEALSSNEVMTIKFRYKRPGADTSTLIEQPVSYDIQDFTEIDGAWQFASAVAQWGMLLRESQYSGTGSYSWVQETARKADVADPYGLKAEFLNLVDLSRLYAE